MAEDVNYGRQYWPKVADASTVTMTITVNELWEQFPEHMDIFVAEALINDPPRMYYRPEKGCVGVFLWNVGGDTLTTEQHLGDLIAEYACAYTCVLSDEQAEDLKSHIDHLERISSTIAVKCTELRALLEDYTSGQDNAAGGRLER